MPEILTYLGHFGTMMDNDFWLLLRHLVHVGQGLAHEAQTCASWGLPSASYPWDTHGISMGWRPPSSWNAKVIDGPRPDLVFGNWTTWTTPSQVGAWSERSRSLMSWNHKSTKALAVLDLQKLHFTQKTEFDSKKRARTPRFRTCGADHAQLVWFYLKLGSPNWMAEHQFAY